MSLPLPLLTLAALACQQNGETARGLESVVRDSAGIQIVANPRPPDDSRLPWRIGPDPTVSVGVLEGDEPHMLHYVFDATMLSDGRIVVANGGSQELRMFDPSGTHVATWGGRGEGPGEFTDLGWVAPWPGDSIVAWHAPRTGISVFDGEGNYGRTFRVADNDATGRILFWPEHATRGGSIMAVHVSEDGDSVVVQLRDGEGRVQSSFGTYPNREPYIYGEGDRSILFWTTYGRKSVRAAWGDQVVIANNSRYEIKAFRADGSLARIVRRDHRALSPTAEDVQAEIEAQLLESYRDDPESEKAAARRLYQSLPVAEHFPAFEST